MRLIGTVQDITERKQAELALKESEERYRIIVETISEGLAVADAEEKFTLVNQAMADILGAPAGELIGHSLEEFLTEEGKKQLRRQSSRRMRKMTDRYEIEIIRPDGEKRTVLVSAVPWLDKEGNYDGSYGVFQDITEMRKAQEAQKNWMLPFRKHENWKAWGNWQEGSPMISITCSTVFSGIPNSPALNTSNIWISA